MMITSFHHDGLRSFGSDDLSIRASTPITAHNPETLRCLQTSLGLFIFIASVCLHPLSAIGLPRHASARARARNLSIVRAR